MKILSSPPTPAPQTPPRTTTASLLARFLPSASITHKMEVGKEADSVISTPSTPVTRSTTRSVDSPSSSSSSSSPKTLHSQEAHGSQVKTSPPRNVKGSSGSNSKEVQSDDDTEIEYANTPRSRSRKANLSLAALDNAESPKTHLRRSSRNIHPSNGPSTTTRNTSNASPKASKRVAIRQGIANHIAALRNAFFIENKHLFLPLLPPQNYVQKLIQKQQQLSVEEVARRPSIIQYEEIEVQPRGIQATMKPYQLSGLSFLLYLHRNGLSGILGDEMGLGKTLQTISLIQYLKENDPKIGRGSLQRPFLVVCPLSVLDSWMTELRKWAPSLRAIRFHGPVKERDQLKQVVMGNADSFGNLTAYARAKLTSGRDRRKKSLNLDTEEDGNGADVVVTTYDSYKAEQSWFKRALVWRYIVLDEGHMVKNHESQISKSLQGLKAEFRLLLTGTPLQNNLAELWALLHWLYPELFTEKTIELFENSFDLTKGQYSNEVVIASRRLLELIMLRRMKNSPGVNLNLPPKTEVLLFVPLSPLQREWYERLITRSDDGLWGQIFKGTEYETSQKGIESNGDSVPQLSSDMSRSGSEFLTPSQDVLTAGTHCDDATPVGNKSDYKRLMNLLMQLRKVCNHPYQITDAEPYPYDIGRHIIHASGKFMVLEKLVMELVVRQKKKIIIFSGFTHTLDLVDDLLLLCGGDGSNFRSARIDGQKPRAKRNLGIRMFNKVDSVYRVMLISTRAGGLGINLATASDVVILDQDWNPQITLQAEARAHRIGQKNPVTVYKLISSGTVEEQMMGRIQKKLYLSIKVTESMQDIHTQFGSGKKISTDDSHEDEDLPQLSTGQLMNMVRRGAATLSRPQIDVDDMLSWDWETTLANCKDKAMDIEVNKDVASSATVDQEEEQKWLTGQERVQAYVFEGKRLKRSSKSDGISERTAAEYAHIDRVERRKDKNTTVIVDSYAVSKESMGCKEWEAVPTLAGKNPALAEPKRAKRDAIVPQAHCQTCFEGGDLICCRSCPRAYHLNCLSKDFKRKAMGVIFVCPQHECFDCGAKTNNAGGMLYRCRWCDHAYCEDHVNFDKTQLIDDTLPEYQLLGFPENDNAFYVQCAVCTSHFAGNADDKKMCEDMAETIRMEHDRQFKNADQAALASDTAPGQSSVATSQHPVIDHIERSKVDSGMQDHDDAAVFNGHSHPDPATKSKHWPVSNQRGPAENRSHDNRMYVPSINYAQKGGPSLKGQDFLSIESSEPQNIHSVSFLTASHAQPSSASVMGKMISAETPRLPGSDNEVIILDDSNDEKTITLNKKKRKLATDASSSIPKKSLSASHNYV